MSNILDQQQEMMKRILDFIEQEKEKLNTLYSECITKMNDSNPNKQVYDNIDELHKSCYRGTEVNIRTISDIKYWYDMNMKQFIDPIEDYDGVSYKDYGFEIYLSQHLFHKESVRNKINIPIKSINIDGILPNSEGCIEERRCTLRSLDTYDTDGKHLIIYKENSDAYFEEMEIKPRRSHIKLNLRVNILSPQSTKKIKLEIDNYLNIYIRDIQTIIINNYTKFPRFVLDSQYHKHFNKSECVVLNEKNSEDTKCCSMITNVNAHFRNYLTSKDQRDKFNDGKLFQDILDFLDYNAMIFDVKLYLDFSSKLRVYGKEDEKIQKELELKTNIIETKDKEIERLKIELKELRQFYINS